MQITDAVFAFIGAWLAVILARRKEILTLTKSESQRSSEEKKRVKAGLNRGLLLEFFLFAPASTLLLLLILPLLLKYLPLKFPNNVLIQSTGEAVSELRRAGYALIGVVSYVLPLATVKHLVIQFAEGLLNQYLQLKEKEAGDHKIASPPEKKQIEKGEPDR